MMCKALLKFIKMLSQENVEPYSIIETVFINILVHRIKCYRKSLRIHLAKGKYTIKDIATSLKF